MYFNVERLFFLLLSIRKWDINMRKKLRENFVLFLYNYYNLV